MANTPRAALNDLKRIVIKVGTSTLMYPTGGINLQRIEKLAFVLTDLRNQGKEVILVSSGAIGVGCHCLKLNERPTSIPQQQAVAAVGQSELMTLYSKFFSEYTQVVGQVLLTRDVLDYPESRENVTNTFQQLLAMGIIPIVNENDTVAIDELDHQTKFGDNDSLSALVAEITQADLLIMLSDIDGFYDKNPTIHDDARLFSTIHAITDELLLLAGGNGSRFGTGGMITKLKAADHVLNQQSQMVLANGVDPMIIFKIMTGEKVGTHFYRK
ncbi:glutamate 5-kinase [Carnobacterium gallinarum]|uniref:glutamate 5-kinase n=1 Tax=Carnobacterium gallinarum TaxID=2749 RepID=UPI000553D670|nr:glutamate 5-kinase [Carnobacterium gallinarum]